MALKISIQCSACKDSHFIGIMWVILYIHQCTLNRENVGKNKCLESNKNIWRELSVISTLKDKLFFPLFWFSLECFMMIIFCCFLSKVCKHFPFRTSKNKIWSFSSSSCTEVLLWVPFRYEADNISTLSSKCR